jgi:hypothetical protein
MRYKKTIAEINQGLLILPSCPEHKTFRPENYMAQGTSPLLERAVGTRLFMAGPALAHDDDDAKRLRLAIS